METKPGISVIICCYNSAGRIGTTLMHLFAQEFREPLDWEIVVVNNHSTDNTEETVRRLLRSHPEKAALVKIVDEPRPGLSYAREKGVLESRFPLLLFCDDDNHLDQDYLQIGYDRMHADPELGVLGGIGAPLFEGDKPFWFNEFMVNYATGVPHNPLRGEHLRANPHWAYGAGAFVRRESLDKVRDTGITSLLSDRKGKSLASGGDYEMFLWIYMAGYRVTNSPELRFRHLVPASRATTAYLFNLANALGRSSALIEIYHYLLGTSFDIVKPVNHIGWRIARHYFPKLLRNRIKLVVSPPEDALEKVKARFGYLSLKGRVQAYIQHDNQINLMIEEQRSRLDAFHKRR